MPRSPLLDLKQLRRYSVTGRPSKVSRDSFAKPARAGGSFRAFYDSLPRILAAEKFHQLVDAMAEAHRRRKPVLVMMGAHVLKVGLSPLIVDLIERKIITAIAMTGSGIIHDFELAYQGQTSEEVAEALADGSFGMARETADWLNAVIREAADRDEGIGKAVGRMIEAKKLRCRPLSVFAAAYRNRIPATVHVAIGTDILHQHPTCDGTALGKASLADFHRLASVVAGIGEGAVVLNVGSAVILPEVFLKAVSIARNLGRPVKGFTAANLDMIQHYRPHQNVLTRPTALGGQAIALTGHHEILVPLLHAALMEKLK
jgi:hypothetical protein